MRRLTLLALAVLALAAATFLVLLARDVARWQGRLAEDDARFLVTPGARGLWGTETTLPAGATRSLLDVDDDLTFRRGVQLFRLGRPREDVLGHPNRTTLQNEARSQLARVLELNGNAELRSRAETLLGALDVADAFRAPAGAAILFERAAAHFVTALAIDPLNDEAKLDLELSLRRAVPPPPSPAGGRGGRPGESGRGAGQASTGSGY